MYVDSWVLTQWAIPEGIFGRLSAMLIHDLSVANPRQIDLCVPLGWKSPLPRTYEVRPFVLPPELRNSGVMTVYPSPPDIVPIAVYNPAVAPVQMLADEGEYAEYQQDAYWSYRSSPKWDERAFQEAAERYQLKMPEHLFWL